MFPFKCMTYHNSAQLGGTSFPGALVSSIKCTIIDLFGPYQLEVHLINRINQLWLVRNHTKQATTRSYSFSRTWNKSQSICFRNNTTRWHACFCVHTSHLEHHWRNFSLHLISIFIFFCCSKHLEYSISTAEIKREDIRSKINVTTLPIFLSVLR